MIALPSIALPDPSTPLGMLYLVVGAVGLIMFVLGVYLALVSQRRMRVLEHALAYLLTRPATRAERRLVAELMESEPDGNHRG